MSNPPDDHPFKELNGLTLQTLRQIFVEVRDLLEQAQDKLPNLITIPDAQRAGTPGYFRAGEDAAIKSTLSAAKLMLPALRSLADKDFGNTPGEFEADLLLSRLTAADELDAVGDELTALAQDYRDTATYMRSLVIPVGREAYRKLKPLTDGDVELRNKLADALNYNDNLTRPARRAKKRSEKEAK